MSMFCFQCEQTMKGTGCTTQGVCGKSPEASRLMDEIIYGLKGLSLYTHAARKSGKIDKEINRFTVEALFSTITNVDFDTERLFALITKLGELTKRAKTMAGDIAEKSSPFADWTPPSSVADTIKHAESIDIAARKTKLGDDVVGLQELLTYGLKGTSAYADHAAILGKEDDKVYAFIHEALAYLTNDKPTADELLSLNMRCGEANLLAMELLDAANTGTYGHPVPTKVRVTPVKGKAILISGHDLKDLEELLKQTEGKGINIYTHGEMLPTNAYPGLHKYKHLVGNYGGAWQDQQKEFAAFPGAVLMTTNCIQRPQKSYEARIFTTGLVAWPGVHHIKDRNFAPVIEMALASEGFLNDEPERSIMVGFARNTVMGVADKVIDAVKAGKIRRFFLIGGCDGAKPGRNYYTELAEKVPNDCVILTLACGKYRFNKLNFGDIGGIPRLLDCGQCNDAYSAIQIAVALSKAFNCGVNDLPLSIVLSWYEQKAVAILLTLLHLGIKNMRLGPSLPAFATPAMLKVLVEKFAIKPISTPDEDLKAMLG